MNGKSTSMLTVVTCVLVASAAFGATITNPSFEANTFTVAPGAISANTQITGWTASDDSRVGLNPAGGTNVFANNGLVPAGTNVAYIQSDSLTSVSLGTALTGLDVGQTYKVDFRLNASLNQSPSLRVALDGSVLVGMQTSHAGVGNPYRYAAVSFTASATNHTFALYNVAVSENQTLLLDDFSISAYTSGWSYAAWRDDASSDISSSRTYTHAYSVGSANSTVINGVPFTGVPGANPSDPGRFSMAGYANAWTGNDDNVITRAGGGSAGMAGQFLYNGYPQSVTLYGLVPGVEYVATLYTVAWDPDFRTVVLYVGDDRLTVNQDHYGTDEGVRISYRYVAPESGSITLSAMRYSDRSLHLYGFSNYTTQQAPFIGLQPRSQVAAVGNTSYLRTTVAGVAPLTYQWSKDGAGLPGETNATLVLSVTNATDGGDYALEVTNPHGAVTSDVATVTIGMIANPSFEADTFYGWPGYIAQVAPYVANVPISGWLESNPARVGINPLMDAQSPFANNGVIPDGRQVAFVQSNVDPAGMNTVMSGLTPGETYTVGCRINHRLGHANAMVHIGVDGTELLYAEIAGVGGTNPYHYAAFDFVATSASHTLNVTNQTGGDSTVLLDAFTIEPSAKQWSYAVWTNDASSGIDATSNYSHAYNFASTANPVINDVPFIGNADFNPGSPGLFSSFGFTARYNNDANVLTLAGGGSAVLARDFAYRNGTIPLGITIEGLVPGVEYETTIYGIGFDEPPAARAATFEAYGNRMSINEDTYGNNVGIRVMSRYTADASGSITLTYMPLNNASSFHTYGFSNREVASTNAPVIYVQPVDEKTLAAGESVTLMTRTGGGQPLFHQWLKNGSVLAGQTNRMLSLTDVKLNSAGVYTLVVSNAVGVVASSNVTLNVGLRIDGLFNTGVGEDGLLLPGGVVDPHYRLVTSADLGWPGPEAYANTDLPGTFLPNGPDSMWISPRTNLLGGCASGIYVYRTTFSMVGYNPQDARISGEWTVDNAGLDIVFNGVNLGFVNTSGFGMYTPFTITNGFKAGTNTLDFVMENHEPPGATGLRVQMTGIAQPSSPGTVLLLR